MKNNKIWIIVLVIVVILLAIYFVNRAGDTRISGESIKIGFISPLTGDAASLGEASRSAVMIAVEEINSAGGIDGRTVEVVYEDGQCNGVTAANAAQKLVNIDKVSGIIGGLCSAETTAIAAVTNSAKVPTISTCSSAATITDAGDYIFRVYASDAYQAVFAADYMKNQIGANNVAVIFTNDDWGVGLKDTFVKSFQGLGGNIVSVESFRKEDRDLRSQLSKIKSSNPEAIYFLGFNEASIPGIRQLKELGINVPVVGGDAWDDNTIWSAVGQDGEGFRYTIAEIPHNEEFVAKMEAKGSSVVICSSQAYDAAYLYKEVIEKVGTNGEAIKNELYNIQNFPGISGVIGFDKNGDLVRVGYTVKVIRSEQPVIE